jgi:hypothetical protein
VNTDHPVTGWHWVYEGYDPPRRSCARRCARSATAISGAGPRPRSPRRATTTIRGPTWPGCSTGAPARSPVGRWRTSAWSTCRTGWRSTFRIDGGDWFDIDDTEILEYEQALDLRRAVLTRRLRCRDDHGRTTAVTQRRLAHMRTSTCAALETTIVARRTGAGHSRSAPASTATWRTPWSSATATCESRPPRAVASDGGRRRRRRAGGNDQPVARPRGGIVRLHLLHVLQTVSPNTDRLDAGCPRPRSARRGLPRPHLLGRAVRLPRPEPAPARGHPLLLRYRYRRLPEARRRRARRGLAGRCSPGSPAATAARRASCCTSTRSPAGGSPTPPTASATSASPSPTTSGSTTRRPTTWSS